MTGTYFALKRFAVHDGPGVRTTLFLKGCPLSCLWCHNPEGKNCKPEIALYSHKCTQCLRCADVCEESAHIFNGEHTVNRDTCTFCAKCKDACFNDAIEVFGKKITVNEALKMLLEDRLFYESSSGGVTISGGEPLMQADFLRELLILLKKENIHTSIDTCGYADKEAFDKIIPHTDLFLYDIKAFNKETHIKLTGKSNKIIWDNLKYITENNKPVIIRFPFVPTYNDFEAELIAKKLAEFKNIKSIDVLPYHNFSSSKYHSLGLTDTMPKIDPPGKSEIEKIKQIFKVQGLKVND